MHSYDAEGQPTTTARTVPLASGTATQVTTQDQDVVSDVILHGVSVGISRRSTQTVSSTGVAPVTVAESFVSRDGLSRGTRSLNGSTRTVTTRPDAAGKWGQGENLDKISRFPSLPTSLGSVPAV